jgi:hypothetical protein
MNSLTNATGSWTLNLNIRIWPNVPDDVVTARARNTVGMLGRHGLARGWFPATGAAVGSLARAITRGGKSGRGEQQRLRAPGRMPVQVEAQRCRCGAERVHIGLHRYRQRGSVDAAACVQQRGEERVLPQLGDVQLDIAGLGRQQPGPAAVAVGGPAS